MSRKRKRWFEGCLLVLGWHLGVPFFPVIEIPVWRSGSLHAAIGEAINPEPSAIRSLNRSFLPHHDHAGMLIGHHSNIHQFKVIQLDATLKIRSAPQIFN